ncbi:MAG: MBL fold metallo-hydrolase [Desulfobacterales bacterium]|nr:MBL fold metallo-hydrolase [Desulfobacterales bacterium]
MHRRVFLQKMITGLQAMALYHMVAPTAAARAAIDPSGPPQPHYRPLNGTSLRALAAAKAHHGQDGLFLNPLGVPRRRKFGQLLRWRLLSENRFKAHLDAQPVTPVRVDWDNLHDHGGLSVTFIKHASVLIKDRGRALIIDPVFDDIFWFIEDFSPLAFDRSRIPPVDHILLTHGHYDHMDTATLSSFDPATHVIAPLGYDDVLQSIGMQRRTPLDWFDVYNDDRWEITLLPCNHWTMRNPIAGPNRALWGSYLIKTPGGRTIYVSGDTAWFDGFHEIGREYAIDLAIINLGAYEPRWFMAPSHMNPAETVTAFKQLNAKQLMVVHWGSFRLGDEPVHFPPMDLAKAMQAEGLRESHVDLKLGETLYL